MSKQSIEEVEDTFYGMACVFRDYPQTIPESVFKQRTRTLIHQYAEDYHKERVEREKKKEALAFMKWHDKRRGQLLFSDEVDNEYYQQFKKENP